MVFHVLMWLVFHFRYDYVIFSFFFLIFANVNTIDRFDSTRIRNACEMLGSIAFMRAVHDDPPMKPLFADYYHLQSDELLGSWFFFLGTITFIPWTLLYIAASTSVLYYIMLALTLLGSFATLLFVRSCYPSQQGKERIQLMRPMIHLLFCCGCCYVSKSFLNKHFANDWLTGMYAIAILCSYDIHNLSLTLLHTFYYFYCLFVQLHGSFSSELLLSLS